MDEDLNEVQEGERRLGRGGDDDEVKSCIVAVGHERWGVIVRGGGGGGLAAVGEQRWKAGLVNWGTMRARDKLCTYGRKLQAELGRFATRVKISEISRCCTLVSCSPSDGHATAAAAGAYELRVKLGQTGLTGIVEHQHGVDHGWGKGEVRRGE